LALEVIKLPLYKPRITYFTVDFSAKFLNIVIICIIRLTEENYILRCLIICVPCHISDYYNDQIKKIEMGKAYTTLRIEVYIDLDGDNIKMNAKEIGSEYVNWIHLSEDRDRWWAFPNVARNCWVP
jgi:hypothetical protein